MIKRIFKTLITSILILIIAIMIAIGVMFFVELLPNVSKIAVLMLIILLSYSLVKENENQISKVKEKSWNKLFKTIDEKFEEIGFTKIEENEYGVRYQRDVKEYNYIQTLDILHKTSGNHIVQSYDANLIDEKKIGNTCVGLTMYEMDLCIQKMKQMGWKIKKV